jgi:hypothetical protein
MIVVEVTNWEKYNPRKDRKKHTWLRLENNFFEDQNTYNLCATAKLFFIMVLCAASKKGDGSVSLSPEYVSTILRIDAKKISSIVNDLVDRGVLRLPVGYQSETNGNPTYVRTNVQETLTSFSPEQISKEISRGALPDFTQNETCKERLGDVSHELQRAWLAAYHDANWITQEILKAHAWLAANPRKARKNFGRFMNEWLSRGYEKYSKTLPSNQPTAQVRVQNPEPFNWKAMLKKV